MRLDAVTFETPEAAASAAFWAGLLDRDLVDEGDGWRVPGTPTQIGLRFVPATAPAAERLHLHVTNATAEDQRRAFDAVLRLGGRRRGTGALPAHDDWYMADPGGNDFCLI